MAWKETLYDASFRGVVFDYYGIDDSNSKSLATHQSPYANAATIHDMGNNPHGISITAIIDGDNYEQHLEQLLAALEEQGEGELVHPVFGSQMVNVSNWSIKHSAELVDGCTVDMQFVLARHARNYRPKLGRQDRISDEVLPPASEQAPIMIIDTPAEELAVYQEQLLVLGTENAIAQARKMVEQIRGGLRYVRSTLDTNLTRVDDLLSPSEWIYGIVDEVDEILNTLPTDEVEGLIESLSADYLGGYVDNIATNWRALFHRIKSLGNIFSASEVFPLELVGECLPSVLMSKGAVVVLEQELGRPTLPPADIIAIVDEVREVCQETIDTLRGKPDVIDNTVNLPAVNTDVSRIVTNIKAAAAQIQVLADRVINQRPPLVIHTAKSPTNLRLLAHWLYADMTRADEILRLNAGLVNPAIIKAGTRLQVYAT